MGNKNTSVPPAGGSRLGDSLHMARLPQIKSWVLVPAMMLGLVLALGFSAKLNPGYSSAELAVDQALSRNHDGFLNAVALFLSAVFSPLGGAVILALACLYLLVIRRSPVDAVAFGAVASVGWLSSQLVKVVVDRHRPEPSLLADPLAPETGFDSFPSGHVSLAVGLAVACYFLARGTRWQQPVLALGVLLVAALAWSRLYIGVHYPSDVLAAMLNASAFIKFFAGIWNRHAMEPISRMAFLKRFGPVPQHSVAVSEGPVADSD